MRVTVIRNKRALVVEAGQGRELARVALPRHLWASYHVDPWPEAVLQIARAAVASRRFDNVRIGGGYGRVIEI